MVSAIAALSATGLLLVASSCGSVSSASPGAPPPTNPTTAPVTAAPAAPAAGTTTPTPSTTPPSTTSPSTTSSTEPPVTTATSPTGDPTQIAALTEILDAHHTAGEFVGARIALLGRDGSIAEATAGTTTIDPRSAPIDPNVLWNIGSVTKTFVAIVVLQLAEEGRIDLDAGIDTFVPNLPRDDEITPRELLQHTSGLAEYINDPAVLSDAQRAWTPTQLIAVAVAAGSVGEPGGAHHYSNTNYIVLGEIIRAVTGHSWADEVRTRILQPLGMTSTTVITSDRPIGYQVVDGAFVDTTNSQDPSIGGAAGALESTDRDLLLFAAALAHGTLLSPQSANEMLAFIPGEDYSQFGISHGYGLGIEQYANDTLTMIGHMGTGNAQSAFLGFDPTNDTAVVVMTNTAVAGPQAIMAFEALTAASHAG
ncbi:MAG: beta-lactamase class [Ilumatobacteraceae bacterium]|nr:beta-lactamase class [Ilumatobacteraceae bacterium]